MNVSLLNVFDSKIAASVFDKVYLNIEYNPPPVCYNESLTLTNVTVTNSSLWFDIGHGTSYMYNISVILDNVNVIIFSDDGYTYFFTESLFSLYITTSSVSNSKVGLLAVFDTHSQQSKNCNIKGVESRATIVIEDCQFHNNSHGLVLFILRDYFQLSNHHIAATVKSCSILDNDEIGLVIGGSFSTSADISVIDTELVGNPINVILECLSILVNNVIVTNSLFTGLAILSSVVILENRLVFKNNTGVVGGGMAINGSSIVVLSPSANLEFIDNHATYKGGGIYIDITYVSHYYSNYNYSFTNLTFTFEGNTAGVAGNDIYGTNSSLVNFDSSTLAKSFNIK